MRTAFISFLLLASMAGAQTINPNQIRPGTNGQVLTTAGGVTGWGGGNFTLGSTNITLGGTFTTVTGLTINGVSLTTGGSSSLFLNQAGTYTAPTVSAPTFATIASGTNTTAAMVCGTGCTLGTSGTGTITPNAINLAASGNGGVTGNLPPSNLNGGVGASSATAWFGDGTWKTISPGGVTSINTVPGAFTFSGAGVNCTGTTCTFTGAGAANISGLTAGHVPLAGSSSTLTANSHIDETTTPGTTTVTQPLTVNDGTGQAASFALVGGTAPSAAPANSVKVEAPASVTAYAVKLPNAQPTSGQTFLSCTAANPSTCTWSAGGTPIGLVPVEQFGAVGDWNGSSGTDNTAAIQACLNSLTSGQCLLQAASYMITAPLTITKSSVGLAGTSPANINGVSQKSSLLVINSASADAIDVGTFHGTYIQLNRFNDFGIQRTLLPTGTASGMTFNDVGLAYVSRVGAYDNVRGFYFLGGYNSEITNSEAAIGNVAGYSTPVYGFYVDSDASSPENSIHFANNAAVDITNTGHLVGFELHGPQINDTDVDFLNIAGADYGIKIEYTGSCPTSGAYDIHFDNATVDISNTKGVLVSGVCANGTRNGIVFNGGWFNSPIDVESSSGVLFANGQVDGGNAVLVNASDTTSFNNMIFYDGSHITYSNSTNGTITGNTFRAPSGSSPTDFILLSTGGHNVVTANTMSGFATNGINYSDGVTANNVIANNSIDPTHITNPITSAGLISNGGYVAYQNFPGFHLMRQYNTQVGPTAGMVFYDAVDNDYPLIVRNDSSSQKKGLEIPSDAAYGWGSTTGGGAGLDTGLSRGAAAEVDCGNGSPGDKTCTFKPASVLASGIVDGTAPVTITTGTTATLGGTFKSGYTFNQEATAATAVAYTLPTAAAGLQYCVGNSYNGSAPTTGVLTVNTSASGQFIIFTDGTLSATGGNVTSGGAAADFACFVGVDATHWYFKPSSGVWSKH